LPEAGFEERGRILDGAAARTARSGAIVAVEMQGSGAFAGADADAAGILNVT
jgi:hypothetical protein